MGFLTIPKLSLLCGTLLAGINASTTETTHKSLLTKRDIVVPNIIGGTYSNFVNVESIAYYGIDGETDYRCTGTLIAPNVVITAAHCIYETQSIDPLSWDKIRIGVGSVEPLPQNINSYKVDKIEINPDFSHTPPYRNDLALIFLKECVPPSIATPIDLAMPDLNDSEYIVAGFGQTSQDNKAPSNVKELIVTEGNIDLCKKYFTEAEIGTKVICVGQTYGLGTCYGDSGGPMYSIDYGKLLGVESSIISINGQQCNSVDTVAVYVLPLGYLPWIHRYVPCIGPYCECVDPTASGTSSSSSSSPSSSSPSSSSSSKTSSSNPSSSNPSDQPNKIYNTDNRVSIPCTGNEFQINFTADQTSDIYFMITNTDTISGTTSIIGEMGVDSGKWFIGDYINDKTVDVPKIQEDTVDLFIIFNANGVYIGSNGKEITYLLSDEFDMENLMSTGTLSLFFGAENNNALPIKLNSNPSPSSSSSNPSPSSSSSNPSSSPSSSSSSPSSSSSSPSSSSSSPSSSSSSPSSSSSSPSSSSSSPSSSSSSSSSSNPSSSSSSSSSSNPSSSSSSPSSSSSNPSSSSPSSSSSNPSPSSSNPSPSSSNPSPSSSNPSPSSSNPSPSSSNSSSSPSSSSSNPSSSSSNSSSSPSSSSSSTSCDYSFGNISVPTGSGDQPNKIYNTDNRVSIPCTGDDFEINFTVDQTSDIYFMITNTDTISGTTSIIGVMGVDTGDWFIGDYITDKTANVPSVQSNTVDLFIRFNADGIHIGFNGKEITYLLSDEFDMENLMSTGTLSLFFGAENNNALVSDVVVSCLNDD
ncbi:hypothetical protein BB559_000276, partial [Furculomyces boomerangus]